MQELQHKFFIVFFIWFLGAFSIPLAFGSVKIVNFFCIKGAHFFMKSAKNMSFYEYVSPDTTKNRDLHERGADKFRGSRGCCCICGN